MRIPDRFKTLKTVTIGTVLTILFSCSRNSLLAKSNKTPSTEPGGNKRPNIVMIISDDQAWSDYGFMGHPHIQTPNLDRLAGQSVVFTHGYVSAPLCCPSLASMITGLHPHQNKITSNDPPSQEDKDFSHVWTRERHKLRKETIKYFSKLDTLPDILKEYGYKSFQAGKWWMGSYRKGGFTHGMTHGDFDFGGRHGDEGLLIGRETMKPLYKFIKKNKKKPFFLWYAPFLPHEPHNPPERLLEKYRDKTDSIHIARYWAMCEWFDETCGQLLDYLDEMGISENTMVLYVCDNGWIQLADKSGFAPRSKISSYDGGVRTPIMVRWPGHMTPSRDDETAVSSVDLVTTALAACGLSPTEDMQGINLLDSEAIKAREAVFAANYTHDAVDINDSSASLKARLVYKMPWKLILPNPAHYTRNKTEIPKPELYNIKKDSHEKVNLAEQNPKIVKQLKVLLDQWYDMEVSP